MKNIIKETGLKNIMIVVFSSTMLSVTSYVLAFATSNYMTSPLNVEKIEKLGVSLIIVFFISLIFGYIYNYMADYVYEKMLTITIRHNARKMMNIKLENLTSLHTGYITDLIKKYSDIIVYCFFEMIETVLPIVIGILSFSYMTFKQSKILGIITLIIYVVAIVFRVKTKTYLKKYKKAYFKKSAEYRASIIDFISNIVTVNKLKVEKFAKNKIKSKQKETVDSVVTFTSRKAKVDIIFEILLVSVYFLVIGYAAYNTKNGVDALPLIMFYTVIQNTINTTIRKIGSLFEWLVEYESVKEEIMKILGDTDTRKNIKEFKEIIIKDGVFKYPEKNKNFIIPNFEMRKGDKISLMGESGQGKSTILNILFGVYDLNEGKFLVDGKNVMNRKFDAAFISQDVEVFDLSIRENLTLGENISDEEILKLFEEAGLMDWYKTLPNGLSECIGERGIKVSVGQKQRLNVIRGILKNKSLYLIDEPTSNLDKETEECITKMIEKHLKDKTYIIVTHRERLKEICTKHYVIRKNKLELE